VVSIRSFLTNVCDREVEISPERWILKASWQENPTSRSLQNMHHKEITYGNMNLASSYSGGEAILTSLFVLLSFLEKSLWNFNVLFGIISPADKVGRDDGY
jgi:hypothetical protein